MTFGDFLERCFVLDTTGWIVLLLLVGVGYTLLSQMLGDHVTAVLGTPVLVLGAVIGNTMVVDLGLVSASDKAMIIATGMAGGMMLGGILVIIVLWSWNMVMAR